jgi:hypothetical protein
MADGRWQMADGAGNPKASESESQRDSDSKPRVTRNELPWVVASNEITNPEGVAPTGSLGSRNPFGVDFPECA